MNTPVIKVLPPPVRRPSETRLSMRAELRGAVGNVQKEAAGIAGAAAKIVAASQEALTDGGNISIQGQVAYLTGALARLMKDLGVVEHLQRHGAAAPRKGSPKK